MVQTIYQNSSRCNDRTRVIEIVSGGGRMTNEELVAQATRTETSTVTGNTRLCPPVVVTDTESGETLTVTHIGVRHKERGYVKTHEKGWVKPETLSLAQASPAIVEA